MIDRRRSIRLRFSSSYSNSSVFAQEKMKGSEEYLRKGKRKLDVSDCRGGDDRDELREMKRQALAMRALLDVCSVKFLQKHLGPYMQKHLGPYIQRAIGEAIEPALERAVSKLNSSCRCSAKQVDDLSERHLQLRFLSRFSLPLFTERKVEWEKDASIHVGLFDATTGSIVTSGPESSVKLDVVVLEGDFNNGADENWSSIEFEDHVINERKGRRPLLIGDLQVQLKEGVGTLGSLSFTDNSSWVPSKMFRFGVKVAPNCCEGIRIREAKTEAFAVKDHRGESYKKHYPPTLDDEVWRVIKIRKDGPFCKSLNDNEIWTVRDFLSFAFGKKTALVFVLYGLKTSGAPRSKGTWEALVDHARTCVLNEKWHVYHLDESRALLFNDIYGLEGLILNANRYTVDFLLSNKKVFKVSVEDLLRKAYGDWRNIQECDGDAIRDLKLNGTESQRMPDGTSSQQLFSPCLSIPVNPAQPMVEADVPSPSIKLNETPNASNEMHYSLTNDNFSLPNTGTSPPLQNQLTCTSNLTQILRNASRVELAPSSPQLSTSGSLFDGYMNWSDLDQLINDSFSPGISSRQSHSQSDDPMCSARKVDKRWRKLGAILICFYIRRKIIKARQRVAPLKPVSVSCP
ncbi:hypothetical protein Scep_023357 [Stephania cephalantha]|uniref:Calmodulin-binding protein n=1 Tax=Stephania cephalantha TaxID=152367 RepID=A0AAP0HW81_9MAGN